MMTTAEGGLAYQRWLATINQVCGHFAARPLEESFHGEIDARYAGSLKVSTVTAAGVNLYRTRNEIKRDNDAWFYTVFQLAGEAIIEQDDRQVTLAAGDITLIDAARPCSIVWQQTSRQASLLLPRQRVAPTGDITTACRLDKSLPMVQLSQRLLLESMGGTTLSASESEAALEAIACLLRPVLHQRDPAPFPAGKAVSEDYCVNRCVHSVGASASGVAGQRDGHVGTQPVPAVCRSGAGGGAVY